MQVIPAINCRDFECVKERLDRIEELGNDRVHIDISDGKFTKAISWNKPEELSEVMGQMSDVKIEAHLMVEKPEDEAEKWLKAGAKRIIVHLEALRNRDRALDKILELCSEYGGELMLALVPETPVEDVFPYLEFIFHVQFLAVNRGFSGQEFQESTLEKIKVLKERAPDIAIEVDGGINLETAKLVKEAGADIVVSASYIFDNPDPKKAYEDLVRIAEAPL